MKVVDITIGLWWSALSCTFAAVCVWVGATLGMKRHRAARMPVAAAVSVIAATYWADICGGDPALAADWRRGAGWVLWPALAWTALTGVLYSREAVRRAETALGASDDGVD